MKGREELNPLKDDWSTGPCVLISLTSSSSSMLDFKLNFSTAFGCIFYINMYFRLKPFIEDRIIKGRKLRSLKMGNLGKNTAATTMI